MRENASMVLHGVKNVVLLLLYIKHKEIHKENKIFLAGFGSESAHFSRPIFALYFMEPSGTKWSQAESSFRFLMLFK